MHTPFIFCLNSTFCLPLYQQNQLIHPSCVSCFSFSWRGGGGGRRENSGDDGGGGVVDTFYSGDVEGRLRDDMTMHMLRFRRHVTTTYVHRYYYTPQHLPLAAFSSQNIA